jgi:FMN phosphatase YigB (HAD superfamily)
MRFEAILFDVGGVLVRAGAPVGRRRWERELGLAHGALDAALADAIGPGWKGGRTEADMWAQLQAAVGLSDCDFARLRGDLFAHEYLEPSLREFLTRARRDYRLGIITNNGPDARDDLQRRFGLCDLVDCFVVSAEEGVEKPSPRIYEIATSRLGAAPPACIFVDDSARNVAGAEAIGMTGIVHHNPIDTLEQLDTLLRLK